MKLSQIPLTDEDILNEPSFVSQMSIQSRKPILRSLLYNQDRDHKANIDFTACNNFQPRNVWYILVYTARIYRSVIDLH